MAVKRRERGTGYDDFYGDDEMPEIAIRIGKKGKGKVRQCARVEVEFADGSKRKVRICDDKIEEYGREE